MDINIGDDFFGLAIGNYIGGFLADKNLSKNILKLSLLLSSLSVSIVPFLSTKITYFLHLNQSLIFISLFSSLALFLLPSVCMGLLYPIILKKHSDSFENIGRRYGSMSAFFTLGGVLGTFLTGFYLVGHIGSSNTFLLCLLFFSLAAFLDLEQKQNSKTTLAIIISLVALISIIYFYNKAEKGNDKILFSSESNYYSIKVVKKSLGLHQLKPYP